MFGFGKRKPAPAVDRRIHFDFHSISENDLGAFILAGPTLMSDNRGAILWALAPLVVATYPDGAKAYPLYCIHDPLGAFLYGIPMTELGFQMMLRDKHLARYVNGLSQDPPEAVRIMIQKADDACMAP